MAKTIIITGAGKGIGLEVARQLSSDVQNHVIGVSRDVSALFEMKRTNLVAVSMNLLKEEDYALLVNELEKSARKPDILINNAGLLIKKPAMDITREDFSQVMMTNLYAPLRMSQLLVNRMQPGGHIVNIGSMGGLTKTAKFAGMNIYSSAKAALAVLSECLAVEMAERKIAVNCLAIGAAQTEMVKQAFPDYQPPVTAEQMARFVAMFALQGNNWFNGQVIPVALSTI